MLYIVVRVAGHRFVEVVSGRLINMGGLGECGEASLLELRIVGRLGAAIFRDRWSGRFGDDCCR